MPEIQDILAGNQAAGARLIRLIEDRDPSARNTLRALYPHTGRAFFIGITGSPGVGKSSLIDALITEFRGLGKKVGVIAVDPSSPVSGGAILGDRLRMQRHAADENVFIRSMASRGRTGGLSRSAREAAAVLDAMGYEIVMIETAGAGQTEVDVSGMAHCVGIVTIPGAGDGIQAIKAGILETGDLFIVNKCSRPETDSAVFELNMMLDLRPPCPHGRRPPIIRTDVLTGIGLRELAKAFLDHLAFLKQDGRLEQKQRQLDTACFERLLRDLAMEKIMAAVAGSDAYRKARRQIAADRTDPLSAAEHIIDGIKINVMNSP